MSTLQQFIDDFLQGNGDDAINAALGHEFIPPPEPSPGPLMDPRAAAALSALAANGLSDEQSTLQGLLSCVPADQQGNPLDILLNLASLFERAGLMTQPRAVAPSVPSVPALPPADDDARGASPARCALTTLPKEILRHVLGTRRARFAGLDRLMYREDIRKLLDRWVPWSRHVDTVPPPPGALAVRWSSFEHMRTYARNARAA